jgi:hypothetical protein
MAETMLDLWERCEAADPREDYRVGWFDVPAYDPLRRAIAATGPLYRVLEFEFPGVVWAGIRRDEGRMWFVIGSTSRNPDPGKAPAQLEGDGIARDAATVPVPEAQSGTWRTRPAQL